MHRMIIEKMKLKKDAVECIQEKKIGEGMYCFTPIDKILPD